MRMWRTWIALLFSGGALLLLSSLFPVCRPFFSGVTPVQAKNKGGEPVSHLATKTNISLPYSRSENVLPQENQSGAMDWAVAHPAHLIAGNLPPAVLRPSQSLPCSEDFHIDCDGPNQRLHAALDEIFVPGSNGTSEILEIPAAKNLSAWQEIAAQVSPQAEIVLYPPEASRSEDNARFLGNTLLVQAGSEEEVRAEAERKKWVFLESLGEGGPYLVQVKNPVQALQILRQSPRRQGFQVAGNFRRVTQKRFAPTKDPLYSQQWHLKNTNYASTNSSNNLIFDLNINDAWDLSRGSNVVVGIADDGLEITHPDLVANIASNSLHYNWGGGATNDPSPRTSYEWHGTALAGLVAAQGDNGRGGIGVAPSAKLAGLRVISANTAKDEDLIRMLQWKMDEIAVKNLSFSTSADNGVGFGQISTFVKDALVKATETGRQGKGTVLVQANGNGNASWVFSDFLYSFPFYSQDDSQWDEYANSIRVISVAAVNRDGRPADYTEHGANISVCAPSSRTKESQSFTDGLVTTDVNGGYRTAANPAGGTSGSAALVSGVAALMLEANPSLGWRDVKDILIRTARQLPPVAQKSTVKNSTGQVFSYAFGAGLVDAYSAVLAASEHQNLPSMMVESNSAKVELRPIYGDSNGVSTNLVLAREMRVESVDLTFTATALINFYSLVFYVKSPAGTEVRMNCLRGTIGGVLGGTNVHFTTPFFWGESGKGDWTVRAVEELPTSGTPGANYKVVSSVGLTWYGSSAPTQPTNDAFQTPTTLGGSSGTVTGETQGATRQTKEGEPQHAGNKGGGSLWWKFQPTSDGLLTLDTKGSALKDTLLAVYQGDDLKSLTVVASNDNISSTNLWSGINRLPVEAGKPLMIAVDGKDRLRGGVKLNYLLQLEAIYNNFAEPKVITGSSWTDLRNNGASPAYSKEANEGPHASEAAYKSVWYQWTPGVSGTAEVWTTNNSFATVLAAYRGSAVDKLTVIAADTNSARKSSRITFGVLPGQTYQIVVDGRNKTAGAFTINGYVHGTPPVNKTNQPIVRPTNQSIPTALGLTGAPVRVTGNNLNASQGNLGGPSVWYTWTSQKTNYATVHTLGSGLDTKVAVYRITDGSLSVVTNNNQECINDNARSGVRWSQVSFPPTLGATYYIEVSGARGSTGRFSLSVVQ